GSPSALAQCVLRPSRAARTPHRLADRETLPMRKPATGEPYAGKPPVRFGGRGGQKPSLPLSRPQGSPGGTERMGSPETPAGQLTSALHKNRAKIRGGDEPALSG